MKFSAPALVLFFAAFPAFATPADDAMAHSKAFERAVNARDVAAVLALYAADAHVVWPAQGAEASGKAAIEALVTNFLETMPKDAEIALVSQTAIPLGGGEVATVGHWTESFTDADGDLQTTNVRTTEIIEKVKGKTLYVVDHASVGTPPAPQAAALQPAR